ncbi:MAG: (2Fe-2S) ferredoxin domain-containing protein [Deltaproteobacteria bacterium]|nr:(2Fe-2S) ferredoxin domain-containing protein [Deltaproteobacteria bacterium]
MEPYKHRIFVCTNNREGEKSSCTLRSSAATLACLKKEIAERGLEFDVKVVPSGCLGLCEQGPNLIVYPEGKWYSGVSTEHVKDFVDMAVVKDQTYAPCAWNDQKLQKFFDEKTARKKMGGASKASSI